MMQSKRFEYRKANAGLLALALIAALLVVSSTPVAAINDTPDEKSNLTACVGEAQSDWGFEDVSSRHAFYESINCLAHYGITIGSGDGSTFDPDDHVKRWQMMLFLTRALSAAGANLSTARDQNFTDVDHLGSEARSAINLMVTNGIATPPSGRVFEPEGVVDRAEMAQLLVRFLDAAGSVVSFGNGGRILLDANQDGSQSEPDDYFQDARDRVPVAADNAISAAYELGITTGAGPTPASGTAQPGLDFFFRPRDPVTRGQMAAFIIRTLGHTLARPAGLSAQWDGNEIRVSLRDDDFKPIVDEPVDMFFTEAEDADFAFTSRGVCDEDEVLSTDGSQICEIDDSDVTTDDEGEVTLTVPLSISDGTDTMLWLWTGGYGEKVRRDTTLFELLVNPSAQPKGATSAELSTTFRGSRARFGTTVTFTVQLKDAQGNNAQTGLDGKRPAEWTLTEELITESPGNVDGVAGDGETLNERRSSEKLMSDSDGRVRFSRSVGDPDRSSVGQSRTRTFKLTPSPNAPAVEPAAGSQIKENATRSDGAVFYLEFTDQQPVLANSVVSVTSNNPYVIVPSRGSARNRAVVSVFNEYGEALSAAKVSLTSSVDDADTTLDTQGPFTVGSDGVHSFSYSYSGSGGEVEKLTPVVDPDGKPETNNNLADLGSADVFWASATELTSTSDAVAVLFADLGRNRIIVDTNTGTDGDAWPAGGNTEPEFVTYDSNDRFDLQRSGDSRSRALDDINEFEEELAEAVANSPNGDTGVGYCLEWSRYTPNSSRSVAEFTLKATGC